MEFPILFSYLIINLMTRWIFVGNCATDASASELVVKWNGAGEGDSALIFTTFSQLCEVDFSVEEM